MLDVILLTYAEAGNLPGERLPVLGVGDGVHQRVQGRRHLRCNKNYYFFYSGDFETAHKENSFNWIQHVHDTVPMYEYKMT
jgi:hypothetical protein